MLDERIHRSKKKRRQPEPDVDPEFQIAPMIDILLVLLVFFMSISSTEVLQKKDISLPVAKDARSAKKNPGQVIINVAYNQASNAVVIEVDQQNYPSPAALIPKLQANVKSNPLVRVLIRADRNVRYEALRSLLEAVGQAGIANVTFSAVDKEAPPQPST